jgi:hypothetical protein
MRRCSAGLIGTPSVARGVINEFVMRVSPFASLTFVDARRVADLFANRPNMEPTTPDDKRAASLPIEGGIEAENMTDHSRRRRSELTSSLVNAAQTNRPPVIKRT